MFTLKLMVISVKLNYDRTPFMVALKPLVVADHVIVTRRAAESCEQEVSTDCVIRSTDQRSVHVLRLLLYRQHLSSCTFL